VAAAFCALNGLAALYLVPESRSSKHRAVHAQAATWAEWFRSMTAYPLSILLLVYFLGISAFSAMTSVLALYMERAFSWDARQMGVLFTLSGGTTVVVRGLLLGPLVKRFGERITVRFGMVALVIALVGLPFLPGGAWALLIAPAYAFGAGTLFPALASLVSRATDDASQGAILGGSQVVGGLGRVLGPLWAGYTFQSLGIATPFQIGAVMVLTGLLVAFRIPAPRIAAPLPVETVDDVPGPVPGG
jgi:predicted MFS family arabinose efflux permease